MMCCQWFGNGRETSLMTLWMLPISVSDFARRNIVPALVILLFVPTCSVSIISLFLTFSAILSIPSCVLLFAIFPRSTFAACLSLSYTHTPGITGCYLIADFYHPPLSTKHKQMHTLTYTVVRVHAHTHTHILKHKKWETYRGRHMRTRTTFWITWSKEQHNVHRHASQPCDENRKRTTTNTLLHARTCAHTHKQTRSD